MEPLERLNQDFQRSTPQVGFEHVQVLFSSTANQDTVISTTLRPDDPENILYKVVDVQFLSAPAAAPCVYRDSSTTRRAWSTGFIILRCNVASVMCTLELSIKRTF